MLDKNACSGSGALMIHKAILGKQITVDDIEKIIKTGVYDVNVADKNGNTLLHYAAFTDNKDMALMLIKWGADVTSIGYKRRTPRQVCDSQRYGWCNILGTDGNL